MYCPIPRHKKTCEVLIVVVSMLTVACGTEGTGDARPESLAGSEASAAVTADPKRLLARIRLAVDDPLRPEEDRARDADRHPAEVLAFFGIEEGMRIVDLQATTGYYTEILSSVVGPDGEVYAHNNDFVLTRFANEPLSVRLKRLGDAGRDNVQRLDAELDEMELPQGLDAALFIRFYHDLFWLPTPDEDKADRKEFLRRVYEALKPGGVFAVVDHHAEAGSGERDALDPREGLHRIDIELVKREILEAGFELEAESEVLSNPEDTRDWNIFSEDRRDKTDRFVLRFIRPAA